METIMPAIIGLLLLTGLIGGTRVLLSDWLEQRRQRSGDGRILLAFPIDPDGGSRGNDFDPRFGSAAAQRRGRASETAARGAGHPHFAAAEGTFGPERGRRSDRPVGFVSAEPSAAGAASLVEGERVAESDRHAIDSTSDDTAFPGETDLDLVEGRTVRFHQVNSSHTMRLLPGRLEVEDGEESQAEIRFVDRPGQRPEVTFGRSPGEPLRHVQLRSATVSRQHARLVREGTDWVIANLSRTNPIVVNGTQLALPEEKCTLEDGDRIEMGEVVFRYYAR